MQNIIPKKLEMFVTILQFYSFCLIKIFLKKGEQKYLLRFLLIFFCCKIDC